MVVDKLIDLGELDLSRTLVEKIEKNEADRDRIAKYFRGRIALVKEDHLAARKLLEETAPLLVRLPNFHKRAMTGLGQCYAAIQNPDKQLEHFAAALKDDPLYVPARVGVADAYFRLGRFREALAEYKVLVNGYGLTMFRPRYGRLEYRAAVTQPAATRNWEAFEQSLGAAADRTAELWVLFAESLLARGEMEKAGQVLEDVLKKDGKNALAWIMLARITSRGQPGNANKVLEEAAKALGDTVELRLARSLVLVNRVKKPVVNDFRALAAGAEIAFGKKDQHRLFIGLGEAASRATSLLDGPAA
jgi:cellulose synthase operon protein C